MRCALILAALVPLVAGCGEQGSIGGLLVLEGHHTLEAGTTLAGDLFVLGGEVTVEPRAEVAGSTYILGGTVSIAGTIHGDVAVVGGEMRLTDDARVIGGLRRGGGEVRMAPGAPVGSELVSPVAVDAVLDLTRPAVEAEGISAWLIVQVLVAALFAALIAWLLPRVVARTSEALAYQPLVPLAVGVLSLIVGTSLLVFMVFTVVLIPVALLMALAGLLGTAIGFVGLGQRAVGRLLGHGTLGGQRALQAALGSAALATLLALASLLPLIGEIATALVVSTALGSWLVTRFGTRDLVLDAA